MALSSLIRSNPKRAVQLLWLAAGITFLVAVFHSTDVSLRSDWVNTKIQGLVSSNKLASLQDHIGRAEASWEKSVQQRHALIQSDWGTADNMPLYPSDSNAHYFKYPYSIWDFTPASWGCPYEMERIGRMGDGGKWVCGMSRLEAISRVRPCVIYSFGVQYESSFENEMLSRTDCEVWAYDFTVVKFGDQLETGNRDRAHFTQAGIAGKTDKTRNPPFYSIADLMEMNGHEYIDVLKMDIEFAEYESMDGLSEAFPASEGQELPIGQFMVEIHLFKDKIDSAKYLAWWERLEARGLRPTWTEPNLLAVTLNVNGDKNPNMAEYTFLNVYDSRNAIFGGSAMVMDG